MEQLLRNPRGARLPEKLIRGRWRKTMNLRIQADELPVTVLEAVGFMANHGVLRVADVKHDPTERTVSFPLDRLPITGKALFAVTRHARKPVPCRVTLRNITACRIEDRTEGMETVELIFGFKIERNKIYFCSSAEYRGTHCYEVTCEVSSLDIEIKDE